jgi:hypothetical protein
MAWRMSVFLWKALSPQSHRDTEKAWAKIQYCLAGSLALQSIGVSPGFKCHRLSRVLLLLFAVTLCLCGEKALRFQEAVNEDNH